MSSARNFNEKLRIENATLENLLENAQDIDETCWVK